MIPLVLRLKKEAHREIARAQDIIVKILYRVFDSAVIHGGTAIWRCYNGNRFSEDVDVYIPRDLKKIEIFFELIRKEGFIVEKKKIGEQSIFSSLRYNGVVVRFEAVFKKAEGILKEYESAEGNLLSVYTLSPEEIIKEKVSAYLKRRKIRDLYDIFFLLRYVDNDSLVRGSLKKLIEEYSGPVDEEDLKIFIIEGLVPEKEKMLIYIKRRM